MKLLITYQELMLAKFKKKEVSNLKLGFQEIVGEELKYGENTSEYSSNRKSNVNDEGHEEFNTANDDILCITYSHYFVSFIVQAIIFFSFNLMLHYSFFTKLIARYYQIDHNYVNI